MKKITIFWIIFILILYAGGCGKTEKKQFSYEDDNFVFRVEIPSNWVCEKTAKFIGDETTEGLPDYGLKIYVNGDKENEIYLFQQSGHIAIPAYGGEEIQVTPQIKGTLYLEQSEEYIIGNLVFENEFQGIWFHLTQKCYDENKAQIQEMIESIQIE